MLISNLNMNIDKSMLDSQISLQNNKNTINKFKNMLDREKDITVSDKEKDEDLLKASKEFETYFLQMMMKEMRKTIDRDNSYIKENNAERIFKEQLDNQMMADLSEGGGIGLAKQIYSQMKKQQYY